MELPTSKIKPSYINPRTLLIYSKPKAGKTSVISGLDDVLIVDTEKGSDFVEALKVQINSFKELKDLMNSLYLKGTNNNTQKYVAPYKYICVDTLTRIDEWSEIQGTFTYMDKPQGKSFNRVGGLKGGQPILDPNHPEFETVHEIGQGFGYKFSREEVIKVFDTLNNFAPHVIYLCHVKDKFVGSSASGTEIMTKEINLTGKLKDIISSKVDAIAVGVREKNQFVLNFTGDSGSRSKHLSNKKIVVSESDEQGNIKFFWDRVYLK